MISSPRSRWPCVSPNHKGQGSHFAGLVPGPHVDHKEREATWLQRVLGQRLSAEKRRSKVKGKAKEQPGARPGFSVTGRHRGRLLLATLYCVTAMGSYYPIGPQAETLLPGREGLAILSVIILGEYFWVLFLKTEWKKTAGKWACMCICRLRGAVSSSPLSIPT